MLNEILKAADTELAYYKKLADEKQSIIFALKDRNKTLEADVRLDWKRRYEKLTGHHGRKVAELKQQLVEQAEDNQRLMADLERYRNEIAARAETHIRVRDENARLMAEALAARRELAEVEAAAEMIADMEAESYRLWCENQLLRAALVKADPEEAKRYV